MSVTAVIVAAVVLLIGYALLIKFLLWVMQKRYP